MSVGALCLCWRQVTHLLRGLKLVESLEEALELIHGRARPLKPAQRRCRCVRRHAPMATRENSERPEEKDGKQNRGHTLSLHVHH